jgi:hypothetical protein
VEVELIDGNRGELTVLLDGRAIAKNGWLFKPSVDKVLAAVRQATHAGATASREVVRAGVVLGS